MKKMYLVTLLSAVLLATSASASRQPLHDDNHPVKRQPSVLDTLKEKLKKKPPQEPSKGVVKQPSVPQEINPKKVRHAQEQYLEVDRDLQAMKIAGASQGAIISQERVANYKARDLWLAQGGDIKKFEPTYKKRPSPSLENLSPAQQKQLSLNDALILLRIDQGKAKYDGIRKYLDDAVDSTEKAMAACDGGAFGSEACRRALIAQGINGDAALNEKQHVDREVLERQLDEVFRK